MALSTISGGNDAPQYRNGLFNLLADLDQAALEEYLSVPVPLDCRDSAISPGPGAGPAFDLEALRFLVNEICPPRPPKAGIRGRKPIHRLPVVCFLLQICDPDYGVVHNLLAEYRRLKDDEDYRKCSGFPDGLPSRSVFVKTNALMVQHWERFRACLLQVSRDGVGHLPAGYGNGHVTSEESPVQLSLSRFHEDLKRLNWEGNLPPLLDPGSVGSEQVYGNGSSPSSRGIVNVRRGSVRDWHLYN